MPSATYIDIPRKRIGDMLSHEEFNQIVDALTNSSTDLGVDTYGLNVRTDADVAGTVFAENATITKQATTSALTVNGTTSMNGKAQVSNDFTVIGKTELTGDTNIKNGSLSVKRNLTVYGSGNSDVLSVTKSTAKIAPGDGSGTITLKGKTDITGDTVVTGNVTLAGPTSISSTLSVAGDTSLQNVIATGNATINGNLTNTGQANLASVNVSNDLDVDGAIEAGGNLKSGGNLDVTGNATVGGDTSLKNTAIDGTASITGNASIGGAATVTGNLSVTGTGTIQNNLTVNGTTTTLKGLTATENSQFSKNLTVTGIVTASELAGGAYSKLKTEWGNNITSAITPVVNDIGTNTTTGTVKYRIAQLEAMTSQIAAAGNLASRVDVLDGGNLPATIYVNGSTGNNSTATGEQSKPFKTIQAAVNRIPNNRYAGPDTRYTIVIQQQSSITDKIIYVNNKNIEFGNFPNNIIESLIINSSDVYFWATGIVTISKKIEINNSYFYLRCDGTNEPSLKSCVWDIVNSYVYLDSIEGHEWTEMLPSTTPGGAQTERIHKPYILTKNSNVFIDDMAGSWTGSYALGGCINAVGGLLSINQRIKTATITNSASIGISSNGAIIMYKTSGITNNATTKQQKTNGGQIFSS